MAPPGACRPRGIRRLDRRRNRPPGGLQGHRDREGPAASHPRTTEELTFKFRPPDRVPWMADADEALASVLDAGGRIQVEMHAYPGGRRFTFADPWGNILGVYQPLE